MVAPYILWLKQQLSAEGKTNKKKVFIFSLIYLNESMYIYVYVYIYLHILHGCAIYLVAKAAALGKTKA